MPSNDLHEPLTLAGQTSAAIAAVAGLRARAQAEYPALWPETVRGRSGGQGEGDKAGAYDHARNAHGLRWRYVDVPFASD